MNARTPWIRPSIAVCAIVAFLTITPPAAAEVVTLNYQGATTNPGNPTVQVTLNSTTFSNLPVGPFYWQQNSIPPNANFPPPIATFCIEIATNQPLPSVGTNTTFSVVRPQDAPTIGNNSAKVAALYELYGRYYDTAWENKTTFTGSTDSVAFQIAIWELIYDGASSPSLSSGNFQASGLGTITTVAQNMLNSLNGDTSYFNNRFAGYELVALIAPSIDGKSTDQIQDQLILRPIPAPPAALLASFGVLALLGRARWLRRTTAAA
ncbi:MAG: hypothetical protein RMJ56_14665 [Gemmataceae bacterium]|nr:hypothetical protein [Gemmata sp.]MDW8198837.1 hypothetical protein [Gemmataceae bacterium]